MLQILSSVVFSILLLSGCALVPSYGPTIQNIDKSKYELSTDFKLLTDALVKNMSRKIRRISPYSYNVETFIITDFVNVNYLNNKSNLGFVLSSELKASLSQKFSDISIEELTLGKDIKIGSNGVKLLTREVKELKQKSFNRNKYFLVGTYAITNKKLMLFLRLVDYSGNKVITSASINTPITREITDLESDKDGDNVQKIYAPLVL